MDSRRAVRNVVSRRPSFFSAVALLLAQAGACGPVPDSGTELRLLDWPGRDGGRVVLNAELRVEFDRALVDGLRHGACRLVDEATGTPVEAEREVVGRFLVFRPALPKAPDLLDGGLRPGTAYALELRGVPRLAAVLAADGSALVGDRLLRFETLSASDPGALVAWTEASQPLRIRPAPSGARGFEVGEDGVLRLQVTGPVDPRSLADAVLRSPDGEARPVPVGLGRNEEDRAELTIPVGVWGGWRELELPAGLEGFGGRPLFDSDRRLGLRGSG